jgi:hypothetical protein
MELVTVQYICETTGCPKSGVGPRTAVIRKNEDGTFPDFTCGVCMEKLNFTVVEVNEDPE